MAQPTDEELALKASDDEGGPSGRKAKRAKLGGGSGAAEAAGASASVKVYEGAGGATTTVTTMAIHNSSSERFSILSLCPSGPFVPLVSLPSACGVAFDGN